jgi:hypothetical protein
VHKEKELHGIEDSISKNQALAREGHENEQVCNTEAKKHDFRW